MNAHKIKTAVFTIVAIIFAATVSFTNAQNKGPKTNSGNHGALFIDANGDGICDNFNSATLGNPGNGKKNGTAKGFGMKNGNGAGICDGTGRGSGKGGGVCDGTGPHGKGKGSK